MKKVNVLALLTERKSNNIQILAIARALCGNDDFHKKNVYFNSIIKLPNFLLSLFPVWLTVNKNDGFNDVDDCDIIVTCGRRSLRYAKHLKRTTFKTAKIVQILKPDYFTNGIDLVVLPEHSKGIFKGKVKNIVTFKGTLCEKTPDDILNGESEKFKKITNMLKPPFIAVYIGGESRHFHFSNTLAEEFVRRINVVAKKHDASVLITTNKRTPAKIIDTIKSHLECSYYFYDHKQNPEENPHYAYINWADYNITTGDSIANISELIASEKPLYIFTEGIKSRKYHKFHNDLMDHDSALELRRDTEVLEKFKPKAMNNLEKLAGEILEKLGIG